jgi:signal peptidase I
VELGDGADTVTLHLPIHPDAGGDTAVIAHLGKEYAFAQPFTLVPGKRYRLEFGLIDRRVLVAIDGKVVAAPLDLPEVREDRRRPRESIPNQPTGSRWAGLTRPVQFDCRGGHVLVHHFTLWRDIHYRNDSTAKHGVADECRLGADEYFMLGDNTANSRDSREWATPGVPERDFLGKPFLVHQPLKAAARPLWAGQQTLDWERLRLLE